MRNNNIFVFIFNINNFKNDQIFSKNFIGHLLSFIWQYVFHRSHQIIVYIL